MTPELIKQWAIQSGFTGQECLSWWTDLSKFAALVAAHQRELDAKVAEEMFSDGALVIAAAIRGAK